MTADAVALIEPKDADPVAICLTTLVEVAVIEPKDADAVPVRFTTPVEVAVKEPKDADAVPVTEVANGVTTSLLAVLNPRVTDCAVIVFEFLIT